MSFSIWIFSAMCCCGVICHSTAAVLISCECPANIVKRGRACSEMLIVKMVETLFIPKAATIIKGVVFMRVSRRQRLVARTTALDIRDLTQ